MPDVTGVPPTAPTGPGPEKAPEGELVPQAESPDSFKAHLDAKLAARRAKRSVPQAHLNEIIRLFNRAGEAFETARLVTKYPPIEKDDALYEVRTDRGTHRVIRARDGSYTVFD